MNTDPSAPKRLKFFAWIALAAILAVLIVVYWRQPERISVSVHAVGRGEVSETVANTRVGTVKACRRTYLAPAVGGQVAALMINEGDQVVQQQLLMEVWNQDLKAQVRFREARIDTQRATTRQTCLLAAGARRDAERFVKIRKINQLVSEERVDQAVTQADAQQAACRAAQLAIDVASAELAQAQAALERTRVYAPFDGTVAEINAELGEFVTPSPPGIPTLPPVDLLDISCLYVSAPIDEVDAPKIRTGMPACVSLDAFDDTRCSGSVSRIAPYVLEKEKQARTVEVEVKLTDPKDLAELLPGYSADIEVILATHADVLRVPTEAVLEDDRVLVMGNDGLLEERQFSAGLRNWRYVEVVSGLSAGENIVLSVAQDGVAAGVYVTSGDD